MSSFEPIRFFRLTEQQHQHALLPEEMINHIMTYVIHQHDRDTWRSAIRTIIGDYDKTIDTSEGEPHAQLMPTVIWTNAINWRDLAWLLHYPYPYFWTRSPHVIYNFRKQERMDCCHWRRRHGNLPRENVPCDHRPLPSRYVS